jgi:hypothetical protein
MGWDFSPIILGRMGSVPPTEQPTIVIGGVDRTSVVVQDSIKITQQADSFTFVAELRIFDADSNISITAGSHKAADEITIVQGATTFFGGFIANIDTSSYHDGSRILSIQCQGYGILLSETLVASEDYSSTSDLAIINDLFNTYLSTVDSVTWVTQLKASMTISFSEVTLADILETITERTGGRFYIDNVKALHYFADEAHDTGFGLSDTPDNITTYPYFYETEVRQDASQIVNSVRVIGADGLVAVRTDATSIAAYGTRAAFVTDTGLTTTAELEERGDNILDKNKDPRYTYVVKTHKDGASAGQRIPYKNDILGVDDTLTIREMRIYWEHGVAVYELVLGEIEISSLRRPSYIEPIIRIINEGDTLPIASRGWSHNLEFSATDNDTVAWAAGTITTAGGVGSYSIDAGDTGNMAAITYVYLDTAVSTTVLQTTTSAANAVGTNKILIAVCENVEATKDATLQVFGGQGNGPLIVAANIASDTITGNEITANSIAASHIQSSAVTTDKLNALAVTATKIASNSITTAKLDAGAVTAVKIDVSQLSAINANMGTLTAGSIDMFSGTWDVDADGFRLNTSEIAGQLNGTDQVVISGTDGKLSAAAGLVTMDESGIQIEAADGYFDARSYKFFDASDNIIARLACRQDAGTTTLLLDTYNSPGTSRDGIIVITPLGDDTASSFTMYNTASNHSVVLDAQDDYIRFDPVVYINESSNADMTEGLTIYQHAYDDEIFAVKSSDVAHGITDEAETDTYLTIKKSSPAAGGGLITGFRDADSSAGGALFLRGMLGETADTSKTTSGIGVIALSSYVKSGTGTAAVGSDGNLVSIANGSTTRFIFDAEGSAHADVEWTTFDEHDDVAILDKLENTMMQEAFGGWVEENKDELERLEIAHFDDKPGHAMINWTKVWMLMVGALRQSSERIAALEQKLLTGVEA